MLHVARRGNGRSAPNSGRRIVASSMAAFGIAKRGAERPILRRIAADGHPGIDDGPTKSVGLRQLPIAAPGDNPITARDADPVPALPDAP